MFSDDVARAMLEVLRTQARTIERLTGTKNGTIGSLRGRTIGSLRPVPAHPLVPREPIFRVWRTFREYFQRMEATVRRDLQLRPQDRLSKEDVCASSGLLVARSLTRIMVKTYGLKSEDWPPSTWPETPPRSP